MKMIKLLFVSVIVLLTQTQSFSQQAEIITDPMVCKEFKKMNLQNIDLSVDTLSRMFTSCTAYTGSADFKEAIFDSTAIFSNSIFNPVTNFSHTEFNGEVEFTNSRFLSPAEFTKAHFKSLATFQKITAYGKLMFTEAQFDTVVNFFGSQFSKAADFSKTRFYENANFFGVQCFSPITFNGVEAGKRIYFTKAKFHSKVNFTHAALGTHTFFKQAEFKEQADFSFSRFNTLAQFTAANFSGAVLFKDALLPDTLLLNNITEINGEIDLTVCQYKSGKQVHLDISSSRIDKIKLDYQHFELFFSELFEYTDEEKVLTYENLLANQKEAGFLKGYEKLDKEFKEFNYLANREYLKNWVQKYWLDYGYNPLLLILRNFAIIIVLFLAVRFLVLSVRNSRQLTRRDLKEI